MNKLLILLIIFLFIGCEAKNTEPKKTEPEKIILQDTIGINIDIKDDRGFGIHVGPRMTFDGYKIGPGVDFKLF